MTAHLGVVVVDQVGGRVRIDAAGVALTSG